jgi:hypothetical protein
MAQPKKREVFTDRFESRLCHFGADPQCTTILEGMMARGHDAAVSAGTQVRNEQNRTVSRICGGVLLCSRVLGGVPPFSLEGKMMG